MSASTASAKRCLNCNKDVTTDQRMKDSSGKYWCIRCGTEQQKKKAAAAMELRGKKTIAESMSPKKARLMKMLGFLGLIAAAAAVRFATL